MPGYAAKNANLEKEGGILRKKKMLTALPGTEGNRSNWSCMTSQHRDWHSRR